MEMSFSYVHVAHSPIYNWTLILCFFFPFTAFAFLRARTTSPAPVISVVVTGALTMSLLWIGLINTMRGIAISGGGRGATSAGIAEALVTPAWTLFSIAIIALAALVRRHRPVVDGVTLALTVVLIVEMGAAMVLARFIAPSRMTFAIAGALSSLLVAIFAAIRLVLAIRGQVQPRRIPFGVTAVAVAYSVMAVLVYQQARHYMFIAMHG